MVSVAEKVHAKEACLVAILEKAFSLVSMTGSFPLTDIRCRAFRSQ